MVKFLISQLNDAIKKDKFVKEINKYKKEGKLLLVPSDPLREDLSKLYGEGIVDDFKKKGIEFTDVIYLSKENSETIELDIKSYCMIFLMGGITLKQNEFIKDVNLQEMIDGYEGIVMGQSAGALNMCKDIFFGGDEGVDYLEGLDLTNIIIDVHFTKDNEEYIKEKNLKTYCITNGGAILFKDGIKVIGDVYIYDNYRFSKIDTV